MSKLVWSSPTACWVSYSLHDNVDIGLMSDFNTLSATLPQPFYLSINLLKYWDGQPVQYICRRASKDPVSSEGVYWTVAFEIVDEDAKKELEKKGGQVDEKEVESATSKDEGATKISADVD